ncbi:hypothetical protein RMO59_22470, partial [Streptomyces alfalfae]
VSKSESRPAPEDAGLAVGAEPGVRGGAVAPYVRAPGFRPDLIAGGAAGADVLADVLGPAPTVARLLVRRYDEAHVCGTRPTAPLARTPALA